MAYLANQPGCPERTGTNCSRRTMNTTLLSIIDVINDTDAFVDAIISNLFINIFLLLWLPSLLDGFPCLMSASQSAYHTA